MVRIPGTTFSDNTPKMTKSPIYCNHANEVPVVCPCDDDCYCKEHTCKPRRSQKKMNTIHEALNDRSSQLFKDWVLFVAENDPLAAQAVDMALYKERDRQDARALFDQAIAGEIDADEAWVKLDGFFYNIFRSLAT